jgi:hypothetical protein
LTLLVCPPHNCTLVLSNGTCIFHELLAAAWEGRRLNKCGANAPLSTLLLLAVQSVVLYIHKPSQALFHCKQRAV